PAEVHVEAGVIRLAEQLNCLLLRVAKVDGSECADALTERELPAALARHLLVDPTELDEVWWVREQEPGDDVIGGGVADGRFAHGERLHHRRVWLLVWLRYDADLADDAVLVHLSHRPILAGPVCRRPPTNALF